MTVYSTHPKFCKPGPEMEKRINGLIRQLTLDEKIAMLSGQSEPGNTLGIPRLNIPYLLFSDGPIGVHWHTKASTCYPASIALAATFSRELAVLTGKSLGRDCRARGIHVLLAPGINLYRSPLCGRNFEYFGEDPLLAGKQAAGYVSGLQSQGVGATLKHYAANNQEWDRNHCSSEVDERTLREVYLRPFEIAVKQGGAACIMTAYNPINGEHASQHRFLNQDILKTDWGFDGIVMSDWLSTYDGIGAVLGGLDLEQPCAIEMVPDVLKPALERGIITEAMIDDKVRRLLRLIEAFGWDNESQKDSSIPENDPQSVEVSLNVAREGIVLLKNETGTLPFDAGKIRRLLVIGEMADPVVLSGGGSAAATPFERVSLIEALRRQHPDMEIVHEKGPLLDPKTKFIRADCYEYGGEPGLHMAYYRDADFNSAPIGAERIPEPSRRWVYDQAIAGIANTQGLGCEMRAAIEIKKDGTYTLGMHTALEARLLLNGRLVLNKLKGELPHGSPAHSFSAKKGEQIELCMQSVISGYYPGFHLTLEQPGDRDETAVLEPLKEKVREADAVIFCAGFSRDDEGEGHDRTFDLPGNQASFIHELAPLNDRFAVCLFSGGGVNFLPWLKNCPALLQCWYPGQNGSEALAEILFGAVNPSGKLPVTFNARLEDQACDGAYHNQDIERRVRYREGVFCGYRHNQRERIPPLFPFGHGLSYTQFSFSNIVLEETDGLPAVRCTVSNTGVRAGAETVQLYAGPQQPHLPRPEAELHDYAKVHLKAGAAAEVCLRLDPMLMRTFCPHRREWLDESGAWTLRLGNSSENIFWQQDAAL